MKTNNYTFITYGLLTLLIIFIYSLSFNYKFKTAQQLFQLVGASATECDTIPGRQCMASCFFLLKQFDDVLVYLNSIKSYFQTDDDFHWNNALTCASTGDFKEA
jgi:intraflagellar transport protein 56